MIEAHALTMINAQDNNYDDTELLSRVFREKEKPSHRGVQGGLSPESILVAGDQHTKAMQDMDDDV
jgi:hypothetical protein